MKKRILSSLPIILLAIPIILMNWKVSMLENLVDDIWEIQQARTPVIYSRAIDLIEKQILMLAKDMYFSEKDCKIRFVEKPIGSWYQVFDYLDEKEKRKVDLLNSDHFECRGKGELHLPGLE